jgi:hypothetical protein
MKHKKLLTLSLIALGKLAQHFFDGQILKKTFQEKCEKVPICA